METQVNYTIGMFRVTSWRSNYTRSAVKFSKNCRRPSRTSLCISQLKWTWRVIFFRRSNQQINIFKQLPMVSGIIPPIADQRNEAKRKNDLHTKHFRRNVISVRALVQSDQRPCTQQDAFLAFYSDPLDSIFIALRPQKERRHWGGRLQLPNQQSGKHTQRRLFGLKISTAVGSIGKISQEEMPSHTKGRPNRPPEDRSTWRGPETSSCRRHDWRRSSPRYWSWWKKIIHLTSLWVNRPQMAQSSF